MLYVDIPSLADLKSLAAHRDDICVSIYLPTTPVSQETVRSKLCRLHRGCHLFETLPGYAQTGHRRRTRQVAIARLGDAKNLYAASRR